MTLQEVEESLATQVERHRVLKLIIVALKELEANDDEGREWVMDMLNDE
ncbi:hypothetical protein [Schlesneria sp. DSM 10557]